MHTTTSLIEVTHLCFSNFSLTQVWCVNHK